MPGFLVVVDVVVEVELLLGCCGAIVVVGVFFDDDATRGAVVATSVSSAKEATVFEAAAGDRCC